MLPFPFLQRIINNKEVKNAGWLIAGRIVQMVLSFLVSIFTARYLGPKNYGLVNYGMAYVAFFMSLCTLGINSVIIKELIDHPDEQGHAIGTTLVLRGISSLFSSLMIIGIVSIFNSNEPVTITVTALCSFSLLFHIFDTLGFWFQAQYKSKNVAIATLIAYIGTSIYKIILLITKKDVTWFAFASSVDYIFLAFCLYCAYRQHAGPPLRFSWDKGRFLLRNSYHYILSGLMVSIYGQTDKIMLKQMLDESSVGYYSLAATISVMWVFVLQAIIDSVYPTIMRLFKEGSTESFERKNRQLYALIIYLSIGVSIFFLFGGRFFIRLLYGAEFELSAGPLRIITWYVIFSYLGVARNAWIVCKNQQKYLKYMYFCAAFMNVFMNLLFIPKWGASGAALASLLTQILTSIGIPLFIREMRPNVRLMGEAFLLKGIK